MSKWGACKAKRVLAALARIGWVTVPGRGGGSHVVLRKPGHADFVWAFHDGDEVGPKMLARIAKSTGLKPEDF